MRMCLKRWCFPTILSATGNFQMWSKKRLMRVSRFQKNKNFPPISSIENERSESVSPFAMATHLFHHSRLKHYSKIRLLTLRVKSDGTSRRTPELKHQPWTAFIRCMLTKTLSHQSTLREKNAPLLIFAFFVCFLPQNQFQCVSEHAENTNRVIFSSHHVEMTHLNCKTLKPRDFSRFLRLCL